MITLTTKVTPLFKTSIIDILDLLSTLDHRSSCIALAPLASPDAPYLHKHKLLLQLLSI
jgi:hypothetical protein